MCLCVCVCNYCLVFSVCLRVIIGGVYVICHFPPFFCDNGDLGILCGLLLQLLCVSCLARRFFSSANIKIHRLLWTCWTSRNCGRIWWSGDELKPQSGFYYIWVSIWRERERGEEGILMALVCTLKKKIDVFYSMNLLRRDQPLPHSLPIQYQCNTHTLTHTLG